MKLYPVNLNIAERICLIVGGGVVAARKVAPLLSCGGRVRLISPEVVAAIARMAEAGRIEWLPRPYAEGDMDGAFLVFAATDDREVQRRLAREAKDKGILVNCVDAPDFCTFQVPARVRRGDFLLTVSTGGGSPALAAKLRRQLEAEYGDEYQLLVDLLGRIRRKIVADGNSQESHKALFEKLLQLNILGRIRQREWPALQEELELVLPPGVDIEALLAALRDDKVSKKRRGEE